MGKLTALKIKSLKEAGRHADGDGLYLWIKQSGARSWVLRVQIDGKRRDFGIGSERTTSLADARERAAELRKQCRSGVDPVAVKRQRKVNTIPTFSEAAERAHAEFKTAWRNGKHQAQWLSTLDAHAFPLIGKTPVDKIDAGAIIDVLRPIWLKTPETARRVRQRIGAVLDWAYSQGMRPGETPMKAISKGLGKQPKKDGHFAALPYVDAPALMRKLGEQATMGRLALRLAILTAARSGEVRGATWGEIDLENALWTIPASRMKAGREHVVPLSEAAIAVLRAAQGDRKVAAADLLFLGNKGKPLSDMTLGKALKMATAQKATVHGFRSGFRDWAAETRTEVSDAVVEAALAHVNPNKVEGAYRRTNFLEQRRALMQTWADYLCAGLPNPA